MAVFTSLVKGIIGALGINVDHSLLHAFLAEFARPNKKIDPLESITILLPAFGQTRSIRQWRDQAGGLGYEPKTEKRKPVD